MSFDSHAEENSLPADYGTLQWWKKEEQPRVKGQAVISTVLPWPNSLGIVSGSHWGPEACSAVLGLAKEETDAGRKPKSLPKDCNCSSYLGC